MRYLNQFNIPKIATYWKKVADSLEFEIQTIEEIEKNFHRDLQECCDEMMRRWLSTEVGLKPKLWSTLIKAIKEVSQLTSISETIENDVKKIS